MTDKNISSELFETWDERLRVLEKNIGEQTDELVKKLEERAAELDTREVELQTRQNFIDECAGKLKSLAAEEETLRFRQKELEKFAATLKQQHEKLEQDYQTRVATLEENFRSQNATLAEKSSALDKRESDVIRRENAVSEAELSLESELAQKQQTADKNILAQKRKLLDEVSDFLAKERQNHGDALTAQFQTEEQYYLRAFQSAIKNLQSDFDKMRNEALKDVEQREAEQAEREKDLARKERRLSNREKILDDREEELDSRVDELFKSQLDELRVRIDAKDAAYAQLLSRLNELQREHEIFKSLKDSFGENPFDVMNKEIADLRAENQKLKEKVYSLPAESTQTQLEDVKRERDEWRLMYENLSRDSMNAREQAAQVDEVETKLRLAENEIKTKTFEIEELNAENEKLHERIKRLNTAEGRLLEREERISIIETELPDVLPPKTADFQSVPEKNELEWLENIGSSCYAYGFKFPRRILYAFHTALKIADWSTITVLAGVSGTGKSALPQLYAKFGGLNFQPVPVQPNWDSQESMLGFFNSIDNKFDAQPLLRFLAQCSGGEDGKNIHDGFDKSLNLVLLDEMNLAHVEHYFAEFLSKLESRRNSNKEFVEIPLGAGIKPYRLKLTRNILWAGTMNQDETTKSLSDKVLDRGLVITFPRPKNLFGRTKLGNINDFADNVEMLDYRIWDEQWLRKEILLSEPQEKFLNRYRVEVFGKINDYLAAAGRALGHRVWQSVEFYTANYPKVIAALAEAEGNDSDDFKRAVKIAVEDQIVQKVMPKLRGIETRGPVSKDCLEKIRELLIAEEFNLDTDFDNAMKLGYGQFMWNSAEYIDANDIVGAPLAEEMPND